MAHFSVPPAYAKGNPTNPEAHQPCSVSSPWLVMINVLLKLLGTGSTRCLNPRRDVVPVDSGYSICRHLSSNMRRYSDRRGRLCPRSRRTQHLGISLRPCLTSAVWRLGHV